MKQIRYGYLQVRKDMGAVDWAEFRPLSSGMEGQRYEPASKAFDELGFLGWHIVSVTIAGNTLIDWLFFLEQESDYE